MYEITTCTQDISVQEVKTMNKSTNKFVVPGAKQAIDRMKYEIASELGVNLGPDANQELMDQLVVKSLRD